MNETDGENLAAGTGDWADPIDWEAWWRAAARDHPAVLHWHAKMPPELTGGGGVEMARN